MIYTVYRTAAPQVKQPSRAYRGRVSDGDRSRLTNITGALGVALADRIRGVTEAATGLTGAAPAALISLGELLAGRSTNDLANAVGLTHSGAVRLVDRLVESGLVERRPGDDLRSSSIVLTTAGRRASHRATTARAQAVDEVLGSLTATERKALTPLVEQLLSAVVAGRLEARQRDEAPTGFLCRLCDPNACGRTEGDCPALTAALDAQDRVDTQM